MILPCSLRLFSRTLGRKTSSVSLSFADTNTARIYVLSFTRWSFRLLDCIVLVRVFCWPVCALTIIYEVAHVHLSVGFFYRYFYSCVRSSHAGRRPLLHVLAPRCKRYFDPSTIRDMAAAMVSLSCRTLSRRFTVRVVKQLVVMQGEATLSMAPSQARELCSCSCAGACTRGRGRRCPRNSAPYANQQEGPRASQNAGTHLYIDANGSHSRRSHQKPCFPVIQTVQASIFCGIFRNHLAGLCFSH